MISAQQHFRNATAVRYGGNGLRIGVRYFQSGKALLIEDIEEAVLFGFTDRIAYQDRTDEAQRKWGAYLQLQNSFGNRNNSSYFIVTPLT